MYSIVGPCGHTSFICLFLIWTPSKHPITDWKDKVCERKSLLRQIGYSELRCSFYPGLFSFLPITPSPTPSHPTFPLSHLHYHLLSAIHLCNQVSNGTLLHQVLVNTGESREMVSALKEKCQSLSCARLFATPWTAAHQAPLSTGFSRQGYWSDLPFSSPGHRPDPGIEPGSPALQADSLLTELPG